MNISFAGCGFLGIYHVGVVSCFKEYAPGLIEHMSGASAGALAACSLLCDLPLGQITSDTLNVSVTARSYRLGGFSPKFDVNQILEDRLNQILPTDAYRRCSGRLHISCTRVVDGKNVILSHFNCNKELIQALICSSFIPVFSGIMPPTFRGVRYIDGCYSDNLPILDENTITVSPFSGKSDICPKDNSYNAALLNLANTSIELTPKNLYRFMRVLFPPHPEILSQMCKQGFCDALRYLKRKNLITCASCLAVSATIQIGQPPKETCTDENENDGNCRECKERRQRVQTDDLPEAVLSVLQEACASMNRGFMNWVFKHRSMKLLSVLTLPYVLPLDIAYVVFIKLLEIAPKISQDFNKLVNGLIYYVKNVLSKINSPFYRAKLVCQLDTKEFNTECPSMTGVSVPIDDERRESFDHFMGRVDLDIRVDVNSGKEQNMEIVCNLPLDVSADGTNHDKMINAEQHSLGIVEMIRTHDPLMSYFYVNERNQLKVTDIYNIGAGEASASQQSSSVLAEKDCRFEADVEKCDRFSSDSCVALNIEN